MSTPLDEAAASVEPGAEVVLEPELRFASVGPLLLFVDFPALGFTVSCSFTCLTPASDFARSLARFLSALAGTEPVMSAVPFVTETCTFANAGSWLNFDCNSCVSSPSFVEFLLVFWEAGLD